MEFEWHEAKAESNLSAHGIGFKLARTIFSDPFGIEFLDDCEDYGEERYVIIGMAEGAILLISARRATQYEQDLYFEQNA